MNVLVEEKIWKDFFEGNNVKEVEKIACRKQSNN